MPAVKWELGGTEGRIFQVVPFFSLACGFFACKLFIYLLSIFHLIPFLLLLFEYG